METRAKRRRTQRARFLDLPEEVFAIILSFHPDRADPGDPIVDALRNLTGAYACTETQTTEYVSTEQFHPVLYSCTTTTRNYVLHSFSDQPAVIVHNCMLELDTRAPGILPLTVESFKQLKIDHWEDDYKFEWYKHGQRHRDDCSLPAVIQAAIFDILYEYELNWFSNGKPTRNDVIYDSLLKNSVKPRDVVVLRRATQFVHEFRKTLYGHGRSDTSYQTNSE